MTQQGQFFFWPRVKDDTPSLPVQAASERRSTFLFELLAQHAANPLCVFRRGR
jgi:hypothetical protein